MIYHDERWLKIECGRWDLDFKVGEDEQAIKKEQIEVKVEDIS